MAKTSLSNYETSEFLTNNKIIVSYLADTLKDGNVDEILFAIQEVIKAKGVTNIAKQAGLSRESLYKSFKTGAKPRFETILKALKAFGLKMQVTA